MSILCKTKTFSFDEIVRMVLVESNLANSKILQEFSKYELEKIFLGKVQRLLWIL